MYNSMIPSFPTPRMPRTIQHKLIHRCVGEPTYDPENGGQWITEPEIDNEFYGAVLPLAADDIKLMPQGTYSSAHRKIYTDGYCLPIGCIVHDEYDCSNYCIVSELSYDGIHPLRRYIAERREETAAR